MTMQTISDGHWRKGQHTQSMSPQGRLPWSRYGISFMRFRGLCTARLHSHGEEQVGGSFCFNSRPFDPSDWSYHDEAVMVGTIRRWAGPMFPGVFVSATSGIPCVRCWVVSRQAHVIYDSCGGNLPSPPSTRMSFQWRTRWFDSLTAVLIPCS